MISVPSHQLPSSGSSLLLVLVVLLLVGCTPRAVPTRPDDHGTKQRDSRKVKDPETGKEMDVLTDEPIDSLRIRRTTDKAVITDEQYGIGSYSPSDYLKEQYSIAFLAPLGSTMLDTANFETGRDMKYLDYYEGMVLSAQRKLDQGMRFQIDVYDTQENPVSDLIASKRLEEYDLIMGADDSEEIQALREYAFRQNVNYVSPWKSVRGAERNPHYLELTPGILPQFNYISEYLEGHHDMAQVHLVVKAGDENRLRPFQTYLKAMRGPGSDKYEEIIISDETYTMEEVDLDPYFIRDGTTVFVLPYITGEFFRTFLRKLKSVKGDNDVLVYGLHHWLGNERIDYDYYESLGIRLASWYYPTYGNLWQRYVDAYHSEYGLVPSSTDAVEGYDHTTFLLDMLETYGTDLSSYTKDGPYAALFHHFEIRAILGASNRDDGFDKPDLYQNRALRMVGVAEGRFVEYD